MFYTFKTQMVRGNSKKILLLVFAIILCIYPLYTTAEIRTFTYVEEKDDYLPYEPRMQALKVYDDGTSVARIVRTKTAQPTGVCFFEIFSLRIIYLNGTVDEKEIDLEKLGIPPINYCFFFANASPVRYLDYHLIRKNHILISYVNMTNPNDYATYEDWGMIIDFDGKEYSRTFFGPSFINTTMLLFAPNSVPVIELNVNREKGFLRLYNVGGTSRLGWQQYKIELDGTFTKLTDGEVNVNHTLAGDLTSLHRTTISTVDEGYTILFGYTIDNFIATNPLLPQGELFASLVEYNKTATSPLLLYQNSLPNLRFTGLDCSISFAEIGQTCVLTVQTALTPDTIFFVKIDFLSSGSATNVTVVNMNSISDQNLEWNVKSLQSGGFLLTNTFKTPGNVNKDIYGYLFNGVNITEWEFGEPVPGNTEGRYEVLPNNTLLISQFGAGNSWQFLAIDLPKFFGDKDKGYFNVNVESTFPAINETINPTNIPKISIHFYNPVKLSDGKLLIYQVVDDQQYSLRQSIPSIKCSIERDGKTVSADVLESTFSVPKGKYFIKMDNNLVIGTEYGEPQLGIRENVWSFMTEEKKDTFALDKAGLLRLTSNRTKAFDNLSQDERRDFFNTLLEELSVAIPVGLERLATNRITQFDNSSNERRYLISIGILATSDEYDNSVVSIIKIIDTLVKHQDQSPIGLGRIAGYLDESYGFKPLPDLWEEHKIVLIGLFSVIGLLIVLFTIAQKRSSESNNLAIIQLSLIIFDLLMDFLFINNNAGDVPVLYIPSIMFFTTPIAINIILAFYIIAQENIKPKFYRWFIKNGDIAGVFTILAVINIKALIILPSNLAVFPSLKAPFSDSAQSKIFWITFLKIFIEDIPQVIIQIYYRSNTVSYGIIPLLALISSAVNLSINVLDTLYQATCHVSVLEYVPNVPDDKDDFVDFIAPFTSDDDKKIL